SFGLQDPQQDGLRCTTSCTFDTGACGPPLPSTPTPPPTEPPTPTPTPTVLGCGNGFLESGETCDDCPADCEVLDCAPQPPGPQFQVNFSAPIGQSPSVVSALIGYRSDRVSLPNT